MDTPKSLWDQLGDQERKIPKCKACMAVRRATAERGFGDTYCVDCKDTLESATVEIVRDHKGKPLYIETLYKGVQEMRNSQGCGDKTHFYKFCHKCKPLDSEMDDFIYMDVE